MTSNSEPTTTQKADYSFALSPGLELTITFIETANVTLKVKNQAAIKDAGHTVPTQTTDSNGHPRMIYGSASKKNTTYPALELEIACLSNKPSHWMTTELKVENGFPTAPEPTYGQVTVGITPGEKEWAYLENEKHPNWITKPQQGNPNFIAISPPQKTAGILHEYQELNPNIVSLLDVVTPTATTDIKHPAKNFLFRGNEPLAPPSIQDGPQTVDFEGLQKIMSKRYNDATGESFPAHRSDYIFHDVCLRNPKRDNEQETHAFALSKSTPTEPTLDSLTDGSYKNNMWLTASPELNGAKMCWWPVEPSGTPHNDTNFLFYLDKWAGTKLHKLLNTAHNTPHVYYIHCANGHDRTGLVAYSYFIARGESQKDAYILGSTVCVSADNPANCVALKTDRTPESGSPTSQTKTRIFPGGGPGSYFDTISKIGSRDSMSWGANEYVDKTPYGVFENKQF